MRSWLPFFVLAITAAGCTREPPAIEALAMAGQGRATPAGAIVDGVISVRQGALKIAKIRVYIGGVATEFAAPALPDARATLPLSLDFGPGHSERHGLLEYQVTLVDEAGQESERASATVDLP